MKAPVLFVGHGSPMNAIQTNAFTETLKNLSSLCANPKVILCVSAHWMTEGTWVTHMRSPRKIHDFYGFPQALFDVQYPAPSDPEFAEAMSKQVPDPKIQLDSEMWGLDHGAWAVLRHLYPEADVP